MLVLRILLNKSHLVCLYEVTFLILKAAVNPVQFLI